MSKRVIMILIIIGVLMVLLGIAISEIEISKLGVIM